MLFKLSYLNSNLALTLGYLNPALNNSALETNYRIFTIILRVLFNGKQVFKIYHILPLFQI